MQVRQDKYTLTKSPTVQILKTGEDIKVDLKLSVNTKFENIGAVVSGTVLDISNTPIKGAIVKLMDDKLQPLTYTETDTLGKYYINDIPISTSYNMVATSTGKLLTPTTNFTLSGGEGKVVNFTLSDDPNALLGAINGTILSSSNAPIFGAVVFLYNLSSTNAKLEAITYTDSLGGFILSELLPGNYEITVSALGYNSSKISSIVEKGKISNVSSTLTTSTVTSTGIISGVISDDSNVPIADADVILYKVNDNKDLIPVAYTTTNSAGVYTFINIPIGSYLIKSTQSEVVNVNTPLSTSNEPSNEYDVSLGVLENDARIDSTTNLVSHLGGTNDGSSTILINVANDGEYDLLIEYLTADYDRFLSLDINEVNTNIDYKFPITDGWTINDIKTTILTVNLVAGVNTLKFHGNGINYAPDLGKIIISQTTKPNSTSSNDPLTVYDISLGILTNEATIDTLTNFVSYLGGPLDNSSTINITVSEQSSYNLLIEYLCANTNNTLSIDINDINTGINYTLSPTKDLTLNSIETFIISVPLKQGVNTLKFHGDSINYAPYLGKVTVLKTTSLTATTTQTYKYSALEGVLANEAIIENINDGKVVGWLGGPKDGSVTIGVNVANAGTYNLVLKYISSESRPFKIDINGINTNTIYKTEATNGWNVSDAKTSTIPITLNLGTNSIKLHGDGTNYAPSIIEIIVDLIAIFSNTIPTFPSSPTYNYSALDGLLANEAKIESLTDGKIVGWLGGPKDGSVTIGVNVAKAGSYNLEIKYVSGETRPFKIDINNENINLVYKCEKTNNWTLANSNTFTLPIILKSGNNSIKIHGDGTNYAPSISSLNIVTPTSSSLPTINIYRKTSLSPGSTIERKKFNIPFHTLEPLGIEILYPTNITILIKGDNIKGTGDINLHDVDNIHYIDKATVNQSKIISIPRKGQLFLNVVNITNTLNESTAFSFQVFIIIENAINYIITPTFDIRTNKIFNKTITDEAEYNKALLANPENGMLAISENVRIYFPKCKFVPNPMSPSKVLALHEQIISEHNKLAGLDINAPNAINKPRTNFVLVSSRNAQVGYMSAGGTMLDTHPTSSGAYCGPGWGIFHEYGHTYEQGWGYIDMWNNMFSANMSEKTIGFTWLWKNDRKAYETNNIEPFYKDYLLSGKFIERGFGYATGLYFFISLQDFFGKNFVSTMSGYYRNNDIPLGGENFVVYAVAKNYGVNIIPYMELYGYYKYYNDVINFVIDNSNSSLIFIPTNPNFSKYSSISIPPTVKSIYAGTNQILTGIGNTNAQINLTVNNNTYTGTCNDKGKFSITITENINENSLLKITSTEPNKTISVMKTISVKTLLSDNVFNFYGLGNVLIATLGFDVNTKTLIVKSTGSGAHSYFGTKIYFSASLYDNTNNLISSSSVIGNANAGDFAKMFHGKPFAYGYYIKLTHAEPSRLSIEGKMLNAPNTSSPFKFSGIDLSRVTFYIRNNGIEYTFI